MTQPLPEPVYVVLCDEEGTGRIVVDGDALVRFGEQLDQALAALEARWAQQNPRRSTGSPRQQGGAAEAK